MIRVTSGVLLLCVFVLTGCVPVPAPTDEPSESSSPTAPPEPSASPLPTFTPVDPADYPNSLGSVGVGFDSPSGNVHCGYEQAQGANAYEVGGCAIDDFSYEFPELSVGEKARCESQSQQTWGGGFTLVDGEVGVQCRNGGGHFWPGELDGYESRVLPYGSSITFGDMICESSEDGMTCTSLTSGHGFRLSRSDYEIF